MKRKTNSPLITLLIKQESILLACAEFEPRAQIPTCRLLKEPIFTHTFLNGRIFNFEHALTSIATYLNMIQYRNVPVGIIFDTPLAIESFTTSGTIDLTGNPLSSFHTRTVALQGISDDMQVTYTAHVRCDLVLHYELLCNALELPIVFISTPFQAYREVYRRLYGSAFRQSRLVDDILRLGTDLYANIDRSLITQLIKQSPSEINSRESALCAGSFYCMKDLI